jgi:FMN-dependent NADH-azoreductase
LAYFLHNPIYKPKKGEEMISVRDLNKKRISELNRVFFERIESKDIKQMKLSNKGCKTRSSVENFMRAAELALQA